MGTISIIGSDGLQQSLEGQAVFEWHALWQVHPKK
jgi:hypothetical protein